MLYHSDAYDPTIPVGSYWEDTAPPIAGDVAALSGAVDVDVAVIGGGYTGMTAALYLARDFGASVAVLEAGDPAWAASGRNGGFCIPGGSKLSYRTMMRQYGLPNTRAFFHAQRDAIELVRDIAARENIEMDAVGTGEIVLAHKPNRYKAMVDEQDFLKKNIGLECTLYEADALADAGIGGAGFHGGLHMPLGFGLHPMKYARGLADACLRAGARVFGQSPVTAWRREAGGHVLMTPAGEVRAKTVIIATNGYTPEGLLPDLAGRTLPVPSNIILTRPLSEAEKAAQGYTTLTPAFDSRALLHYFRLLPDGRFLLGARGELNMARESAARMQARVTADFRRMFPAWADVDITHFWRGFVCMSWERVPHVGQLDGGGAGPVLYGLAYHGNGVSTSAYVGRALARMASEGGSVKAAGVPAIMTLPARKFPLPGLRLLYLRLALLGYRVQDNWL